MLYLAVLPVRKGGEKSTPANHGRFRPWQYLWSLGPGLKPHVPNLAWGRVAPRGLGPCGGRLGNAGISPPQENPDGTCLGPTGSVTIGDAAEGQEDPSQGALGTSFRLTGS